MPHHVFRFFKTGTSAAVLFDPTFSRLFAVNVVLLPMPCCYDLANDAITQILVNEGCMNCLEL